MIDKSRQLFFACSILFFSVKINNLVGVISNENPVGLYFGLINGKMVIIRDFKAFPQEDVYIILQSLE